jgi:hypothetical protein
MTESTNQAVEMSYDGPRVGDSAGYTRDCAAMAASMTLPATD